MQQTITQEQQHLLCAKFAALAICIHLFESSIPSIMGIKPGLANVITLIVLLRYGIKMAVQVQVLRILIASLLNGSLLTPTFFLSLCGASCSLIGLLLLYKIMQLAFKQANMQSATSWQASAISFSVLAALMHMLGQFLLAYLWLIPHTGLFKILPFLLLIALVFGWANGIMAQLILTQLNRKHTIEY